MRDFCCKGCDRPEIDTPQEDKERQWLVSTLGLCRLREVGPGLDDLREFLCRASVMGAVSEGYRRKFNADEATRIYKRWVGLTVEVKSLTDGQFLERHLDRARAEAQDYFNRVRFDVDSHLEYLEDAK